jgi:hypothetical protein
MLREEQRPKAYRARYLNLGEAKQQTDKNYVTRTFIICTLHIILFVSLNQGGLDACSIQGRKKKLQTKVWLENLKGKHHRDVKGVDGFITSK